MIASANVVASVTAISLLMEGKDYDEMVRIGRASVKQQQETVTAGLNRDLETNEDYANAAKLMLNNIADFINAKLPR